MKLRAWPQEWYLQVTVVRQDEVQQVSDSALSLGRLWVPFPEPSAQNSQHLWKTFCLWSTDTLPNNWHFLLLLQHPKGMPDGALRGDTRHTLLNPLPSTLGATWLPLPRMLPYSLNIFWGLSDSVFSLLFPALSSLNQTWGDEMPVSMPVPSWSEGPHTPVILAHCPARQHLVVLHPSPPDMPRALIYPQLQLSQLRHRLSAPRVYRMKPWLTHRYSGLMLCSLQGFHEN